jgi:hypothetical protein
MVISQSVLKGIYRVNHSGKGGDMKQCKCVWVRAMVAGAAVCLGVWAGVAGTAQAAGEAFVCAEEDKIRKTIAPEAQLESLTCFFDTYEGAEVLHFKLAVKNITQHPQRYRIHIFMDNGKAVGGLIPSSTKKGLIEPGKSGAFTYPVTGMTGKPGSVEINIATMAD